MTTHVIGTRKEWLAARLALLKSEKEFTHRGDELAHQRQALPWVKVDKNYHFDTDVGQVSLANLFQGRSQLLIYHFMYGQDYTAGCPHCSAIADGFNGFYTHLANHDVMLWAVSRAPLAKLEAYKKRMGWSFPWASSNNSDFSADFGVAYTEEQLKSGAAEYNFGSINWPPVPVESSDELHNFQEAPGMSAFAMDNGVIYHTYSTYGRGLDGLWGLYQWLDRAPLGRNEDGMWMRRHDEY